MDNAKVKTYVLAQTEIDSPTLQKQFSLSYAQAKSVIDELIEDESIAYDSGLSYKVIKQSAAIDNGEKTDTAEGSAVERYIKVLWECIKANEVSVQFIQNVGGMHYFAATACYHWMIDNGYVGGFPLRRIKISKDEFCAKFGDPDTDGDGTITDDELERFIKASRRDLSERLRILRCGGGSDDSDDDDKDEEDDAEDDKTELFPIMDFLERYDGYQGILDAEDNKHILDADSDDDADGEQMQTFGDIDLKPILIESIECGLRDVSADEKYVLGLDGEPELELKFVCNGCKLYISDGGQTQAMCVATERKIKNRLKDFSPVEFDDGIISITIDDPLATLKALILLCSAIDAVKRIK